MPEKEGSLSGLKEIGGFEIVQIERKDAKVMKLIIKSNLDGNLRLRTMPGNARKNVHTSN